MEFARHKSVAKYGDTVAIFETAVAAGWNSPIAKASVRVEMDHPGKDAIIFEVKDPFSEKPTRIVCAPDEAPQNIQRRAYTAMGEHVATTGTKAKTS